MTNEESIRIAQGLITDFKCESETMVDFCNTVMEALEHTSALDKARAEIAAYGSIWVEYCITGHTDHDIETIVENVLKQAKEQVLAVIDKYRESEG